MKINMNKDKFIIILLLIIGVLYLSQRKKGFKVKKVRSDIDNKMYVVRDREDSQKATNMLARIRKNIFILKDHLVDNQDTLYMDMKPYIEQLDKKIRNVKISESDGSSKYTSYSVNKGEELVFCLRSLKDVDKIHELNLIMYVTLHEISHVACPEYGHTPLFKKIFAFFTKTASHIGIYNIINFNNNSREYCGLLITDSIL